MEEISILQYVKEYEQGVCSLLNKFNPHENLTNTINKFRWFYDSCPYTGDINAIPLFIAINSDNKVIGIRGFFTLKYDYKGNTFYSLGPSGAYVDSEYRRYGVFNKLNQFALTNIANKKNIKLYLNLSSNQYSSPGYLKLGWKEMEIKTYLYRYNYFKFFRKSNLCTSNKYKGYDVEISNKDIAVDHDLLKSNNIDKFSLLRDTDYYKWRLNNPIKKENLLIKLYYNGENVAYVILKKSSQDCYSLFEYKYRKLYDFKVLIKYIIKNIDHNLLSVWALSRTSEEINILKYHGFIHLGKRFYKLIRKPKMPALIRPNSVNPNHDDWILYGKDIRDAANWDLYYSDIDG